MCSSACVVLGICCKDSKLGRDADEALTEILGRSTCEHITRDIRYWTVTVCPENYQDTTIRENCEQPFELDNIPASVNRSIILKKIAFRNRFCAICNGFRMDEISLWEAKLKCPNDILSNDTLDSVVQKCDLDITQPDAEPLRCLSESKECGNGEGAEVKELCRMYFEPVHKKSNKDVIYRNSYCAGCNGIYNDTILECATADTLNVLIHSHNKETENQGPGISINILFSFDFENFVFSPHNGPPIVISRCPTGQVYNDVTGSCQDIQCPLDSVLIGNECDFTQSLFSYPIDEQYKIVIFSFTETNTSESWMEKQTCFNSTLGDANMEKSFPVEDSIIWTITISYITEPGKIGILLNGIITCAIEVLLDRSLSLSNFRFSNFDKANTNATVCFDGFVIKTAIDKEYDDIKQFLRSKISISDVSFQVSRLKYEIEITNSSIILKTIWYCMKNITYPAINCTTFLAYDRIGYEIKDGVAYIINSSKIYENGSYFVENSTLYTCGNSTYTTNATRTQSDNPVLTYLTAACLSISCVSLISLILIHCVYRDLRNLHGKMIVSFSIILAQSHFIMLIQSSLPSVLCRPVAMVLHYSWTCVAVWSGIMGFDLARKLNMWTLMTVQRTSDEVLFLRYSLVAWLSPAVLVITCIVLDYKNAWTLINYGNPDLFVCWIGNHKASIWAFIVPVSTILLANISFLAIVMCGIESAKRAAKNIQKSKKDKSRCFIYTKIFLLIGLTWITSYVASFLKLEWMYILNTIINGIQGLFLLLVVLHSNYGRVLRLGKARKYKSRLGRDGTVTETSQTGI